MLFHIRPVTSLEHQVGEEFSERGPNFSNYAHIFKLCPTHVLAKKLLGRILPWLRACFISSINEHLLLKFDAH